MDTKDKILLAGPWVGELGWELFCWQAYIRKLSRNYKKTYVISRPGQAFLYSDFADQYHEFDPKSWETSLHRCFNMKANPSELLKKLQYDHYFSGDWEMPIFYDGNEFIDKEGCFYSQEFHIYKPTKDVKKYDIIIHPRNKTTGSERNWNFNKWQDLVYSLRETYSIGCIGNMEAFKISGADDLRGIPLEDTVSYIGNCKLVVGPSSGPMHLASLCNKKHLVWSTEVNRLRYESVWNPFNTELKFVSEGDWDPDVSLIEKSVREFI